MSGYNRPLTFNSLSDKGNATQRKSPEEKGPLTFSLVAQPLKSAAAGGVAWEPNMATPTPEPPWWPNGADEQTVRQCNCNYCAELIDALEQDHSGEAIDGQNASLNVVAEVAGDD